MLERGAIPKLKALSLHNGTVYRWNRACYGVGNGKPHLRIENRYIPSGPTIADEVANMVFWVGLMVGRPHVYDNIQEKLDFKDAKANFFNAARYGMATQFKWNNKLTPSHDLILDELLPIAYRGLYSVGISPKDAEHYLTIIKNRVDSHTGSEWMVKSYRNLLKTKKPLEAIQTLTTNMVLKQEKNFPVCSWSILKPETTTPFTEKQKAYHIMNTDIFSVNEKDSIELVMHMMKWKNIHHMPVINDEKELVGLISSKDLETKADNETSRREAVKNIMVKDLIIVDQFVTVSKTKALMKKHNINSIPVVKNKTLVGIITSKDL
jgi:CBS domain-containing protein